MNNQKTSNIKLEAMRGALFNVVVIISILFGFVTLMYLVDNYNKGFCEEGYVYVKPRFSKGICIAGHYIK